MPPPGGERPVVGDVKGVDPVTLASRSKKTNEYGLAPLVGMAAERGCGLPGSRREPDPDGEDVVKLVRARAAVELRVEGCDRPACCWLARTRVLAPVLPYATKRTPAEVPVPEPETQNPAPVGRGRSPDVVAPERVAELGRRVHVAGGVDPADDPVDAGAVLDARAAGVVRNGRVPGERDVAAVGGADSPPSLVRCRRARTAGGRPRPPPAGRSSARRAVLLDEPLSRKTAVAACPAPSRADLADAHHRDRRRQSPPGPQRVPPSWVHACPPSPAGGRRCPSRRRRRALLAVVEGEIGVVGDAALAAGAVADDLLTVVRVWKSGGASPAARGTRPHVWSSRHPNVAHAVSVPTQSPASMQPTHVPKPSHIPSGLQGVPGADRS